MSDRICTFEPCTRRVHAWDLCNGHYRQSAEGRQLAPITRTLPPEQRFWLRVDRSGECWTWTGTLDASGYGRMKIGDVTHSAHRLAYELVFGSIPDGHHIDHICHHVSCVNPEHLRAVSRTQNMQNRSGAMRSSYTGIRGVRWRASHGKWAANATVNGKRSHLGYFDSSDAAESAVIAFRREHMPSSVMDQAEIAMSALGFRRADA